MKVGIFLEGYSAPEGGGYTIQTDLLHGLVALEKETDHSFVVLCRNPSELSGLLKSSAVTATAFPGKLSERVVADAGRKLSALRDKGRTQTRLEQISRDAGIDFIWFLGAEAVQVDLPYMGIVWDLQHRLQPWFPEVSANGVWAHREAFYSEFLPRATYVLAGTKVGSEEIQRFYQVPAERIRILPHPTPAFALASKEVDAGALAGLKLPPDYLLYPAQFWSHKNHAGLLLALQNLKQQFGLTVPVVFVGSDKGNQGYIKQLAQELDVASQVHFPGFVSQAELIALYRNALALTYVTYFGPENLPPLEAFALGCPVIASNVAGAEEQLGDAAVLVDPKSPQAIAQAIQAIHKDPHLRERLVEKGKARAAKWTGQDFVKAVFSLLDEFENVRRTWPR
jgi:glycosyltransferase involved in cell wall biosynthesis